ncbi:MAG: PadR family transcriptional regulator [Candidatus Cloacimonadota bacterium]|nr:PadR family transcriptional regulator [Candidatus Cloacimonadota bacterium]
MKLRKDLEKTVLLWKKEYKKGFTSFMILLLLKEHSMYGYEIKQQLGELTGEQVQFQDSAVYHILKRMNKKEFVTFEWRKSTKGPKRKYYVITNTGKQLVKIFAVEYIRPMSNALNTLMKKHFPDNLKNI